MAKKVTSKKKDVVKKDYKVGKGKPPEATKWKKGFAPNPTGINQPKAVRAMKALTENTLQSLIEDVMTKSRAELKAMLKDKDIPLAHSIVIKTAIKADTDMSFHQFNEILNRAIGTIKQKIDHSSEDGSMSPHKSVTVYLPDNQREK